MFDERIKQFYTEIKINNKIHVNMYNGMIVFRSFSVCGKFRYFLNVIFFGETQYSVSAVPFIFARTSSL